jgi:hypothetical protein
MRLLLDECVPRQFIRELSGLDVSTVVQEGWSGMKNGELLRGMAERAFDVLITTDRNLRYQQNVAESAIAVVVLEGPSNRLADLIPLVGSLRQVLTELQPGTVARLHE